MKRILIIEDQRDIIELATVILEDEGYQVITLDDFSNYKPELHASGADLVLLDLNLNGYYGKDICQYIKSDRLLQGTTVVLMSANRDIETVKEESGADACISKPFDLYHFIGTVRSYLN